MGATGPRRGRASAAGCRRLPTCATAARRARKLPHRFCDLFCGGRRMGRKTDDGAATVRRLQDRGFCFEQDYNTIFGAYFGASRGVEVNHSCIHQYLEHSRCPRRAMRQHLRGIIHTAGRARWGRCAHQNTVMSASSATTVPTRTGTSRCPASPLTLGAVPLSFQNQRHRVSQ